MLLKTPSTGSANQNSSRCSGGAARGRTPVTQTTTASKVCKGLDFKKMPKRRLDVKQASRAFGGSQSTTPQETPPKKFDEEYVPMNENYLDSAAFESPEQEEKIYSTHGGNLAIKDRPSASTLDKAISEVPERSDLLALGRASSLLLRGDYEAFLVRREGLEPQLSNYSTGREERKEGEEQIRCRVNAAPKKPPTHKTPKVAQKFSSKVN